MDDYKRRYIELKSRWEEYCLLQVQLRKDRKVIYITSCLAFQSRWLKSHCPDRVFLELESRAFWIR